MANLTFRVRTLSSNRARTRNKQKTCGRCNENKSSGNRARLQPNNCGISINILLFVGLFSLGDL